MPAIASIHRNGLKWVHVRKDLLLAVAWILCLAGRAVAAPGAEFLVDVWDTEAGLPDSTVTAVQQTRDGYLWVGTYNGLARFDGIHFEIFDPLNTPALTHPRIQDLFLDANGVLWINTYDGSLISLQSGEFRLEYRGTVGVNVRFSLVHSTANEIAFGNQMGDLLRRRVGDTDWEVFRPEQSPRPSYYYEDAWEQVWWHKLSQGLYGRVRGEQLETEAGPPELRGAHVNFLTVGPAGRLWVGADRGIACWEGEQCDFLTPTNSQSLPNVEFILPMGGGTNWVLTNGRLRKQEGRRWVTEIKEWQGLLGTTAGRRMGAHLDRAGGVWFNHYGNGVFYISPQGQPLNLTSRDGLPGNRISAWFEDREGNIWVGVDRGGLARLRPAVFQVIGQRQGMPTRAVTSVIEDSRDNIWLATFGGGVHEWRDNTLRRVPLDSHSAGFVFSLCEVRPGVTWMSAVDEDLYVLDRDGFRRAPWNVHGVKALTQDARGRLWAGWKDGVGYWDPETQEGQAVEQGFEPAAVRALRATSDGGVWFGCDDGSLYRYAHGTLARFRTEDPLSSQPIWSLWASEDGTVWIGTFRGGLLRFKEGTFTRYSRNDGLPDDIVSQILEDGQGRLWCGSYQGIFHVDIAALNELARGERTRVECVVYGRLDGLPSLECSGGYNPSCLRTRDGRLWFATAKGLVSVNPDRINSGYAPPPVVIQEVRVDDVRQPLPHAGRSDAPKPVSLEIPPGRRQFRFHYAALNLSSPEKVRFRHRLIGHEREWIDAGTRREAVYSSLPPGHYEFQVTARNSEGEWNPQVAAVAFEFQPYFYQTWWFRGVGALVLLSVGIFTVRRLATRKLRRELVLAERRHAIELDRARIAQDIHDELGAGLTEIGLLSELARRDREGSTPGYLTQISAAARALVRAMDETVWAVNPANDTLEGLITYASKLAQDHLSVAGIRCRLEVPTRIPEVRIEADTRHHLYLAIKETLNNIVKHSQATEATLRLRLEPGQFTLSIEDNGRGLTAQPSPDEEDAALGRLQSGHGLSNLKRRLEECGGCCVIRSHPGRGTIIELIMKSTALQRELGDKPKTKG